MDVFDVRLGNNVFFMFEETGYADYRTNDYYVGNGRKPLVHRQTLWFCSACGHAHYFRSQKQYAGDAGTPQTRKSQGRNCRLSKRTG